MKSQYHTIPLLTVFVTEETGRVLVSWLSGELWDQNDRLALRFYWEAQKYSSKTQHTHDTGSKRASTEST